MPRWGMGLSSRCVGKGEVEGEGGTWPQPDCSSLELTLLHSLGHRAVKVVLVDCLLLSVFVAVPMCHLLQSNSQVTGELSTHGSLMRSFVQTFVLAPKSETHFYILNDIFRFQVVCTCR